MASMLKKTRLLEEATKLNYKKWSAYYETSYGKDILWQIESLS